MQNKRNKENEAAKTLGLPFPWAVFMTKLRKSVEANPSDHPVNSRLIEIAGIIDE